MKCPKVSVIMCCYNSERFLRPAIDSVLNQTFPDFELLVWNDGSTDATEEIVLSYTDPRVRYFRGENRGAGIARAEAAKHAVGEYIAVLDSDDISLPERLELEVAFLDSHPDYVLVGGQAERIDENDRYIGQSLLPCSDRALKRRLTFFTSSVLFRRSAYDDAGGFMDIRTGQDVVLFGRMEPLGKFYNLPRTLIRYRHVSTSIGRTLRQANYNACINQLRLKIISDPVVDPRDIETLNAIWRMNKEVSRKLALDEHPDRGHRLMERLIKVLSALLGRERTVRWLCRAVTLVKEIL